MLAMMAETGKDTKVRVEKVEGKVLVYINDVLIPFARTLQVSHEGTMTSVKLEFFADMEYGPKEECCGGC